MPLHGWVHYGRDYDNAFWDGEEMVFGDGKMFDRFTKSLDVIGHELTHGVTEHEAGLQYLNQSGALNESVSDVFGSLVKQYKLGQTADEADWLIGADLVKPGFPGKALRSMAAARHRLGRRQPAGHMDGYVQTLSDNGGVHTNSGIPNKAFAELSLALGGPAWEKAGRIWYETLRDPLVGANATFRQFADRTLAARDSSTAPAATRSTPSRRAGTASASPLMAGEPERIEFARSGGFANIPVRASVPADALDPHERAGLDALLSRAPADRAQAGAPDRYQYDVTVVAGDRRHRVRLGEREVDEPPARAHRPPRARRHMSEPTVIPPGGGEVIGDSPDRRVEILSDHDALHATWSRFGPRRDGADLHVHRRHTDLFYVLEGELTVRLGRRGQGVAVPARDARARAAAGRPRLPQRDATRSCATSTSTRPGSASPTTCARCATAARSPTTRSRRRRTARRPATEAVVGGDGFQADGMDAARATSRRSRSRTRRSDPRRPPPPHVHPRHVESFYVLKGELAITVDGREHRAGAARGCRCRPGVAHAVSSPGAGALREPAHAELRLRSLPARARGQRRRGARGRARRLRPAAGALG